MQRLKFQLPPVIARIYPEEPSIAVSPADGPGSPPPPSRKPTTLQLMAPPPSAGPGPLRRKASSESRSTEATELSGTPRNASLEERPGSGSSDGSPGLPPPPRMPGPSQSPSPSPPPPAVTVEAAPGPGPTPNGLPLTPRTITVRASDAGPGLGPGPGLTPPPASKSRRLLHPLAGADPAWLQVEPEEAPNGSAGGPGSPTGGRYLSKRRHTVSATASIAIDKLKAFFRRDSSANPASGDGRHDSVVTIGSAAFSDASRRGSSVSYAAGSGLGLPGEPRGSASGVDAQAAPQLSCLNAWCSDFFYCGKEPPPNSPQAMLEKHQCARFVTVVTILVIIGVVITLIVKASRGES